MELKSFGKAREALADGFFQAYCQDGQGGASWSEVRLRLHLVLCLLELIWTRRQMSPGSELRSMLPDEEEVRE
eukprot:CAMPEP_0197669492 /NCGR_PEP_ID=MMETSP1338-20131121/72118_1 /TAXON_ID=43686 ORGANISM="Pelagodinium beii, Strain RCC1491" /NCGR_SAMPLE_ID=MMETSP1338 /ASSEMBLY_ACC=CAM_ASM_000754 /LENGTH=72 /DNA_ID=CAMNT_0043249063 /DNA_START=27 /DNA_END=242 /DNA_ORIENTATION=-